MAEINPVSSGDMFIGIASGEVFMGKIGAPVDTGAFVHWNGSPAWSLYNAWYSGFYGSWCAAFVSWCANKAGILGSRVPKFKLVIDGAKWYQDRGLWYTNIAHAKRGDIVFYKVGTSGNWANHVGIIEKNLGNGKIQTLEGNTSRSVEGDQRASGCVARKTRTVVGDGYRIVGFGFTDLSGPLIVPPDATWNLPGGAVDVKLVADGYWGKMTTRFLQQKFGTYVDGEIWSQYAAYKASNPGLTSGWGWTSSPKGSPLITAMQRWLGVGADGIAGPTTFAALQRRLGRVADGAFWGPSPAIAEMQRRLNAGTL